MAFIDVINYNESDGRLKEIYDDIISSRGQLAEVHKIQSLNPESIVHHMDLYIHTMFGRSPLKRAQREMLAVVVSKANNCNYCQEHHGVALNHFWKDEERLRNFKEDYSQVGLAQAEEALCALAWEITVNPAWAVREAHLEKLKSHGFEDRAILDAMLVISYFNFVNRMVLGLGVSLETHKGVGFKYD